VSNEEEAKLRIELTSLLLPEHLSCKPGDYRTKPFCDKCIKALDFIDPRCIVHG
jgi:hypothetical protein